MSSCIAFHTQVASIMEVLANAAVAEICKLVDDGYAVLRLEMSQSQKENEELRRKLEKLKLELQLARVREKASFSPDESVFGDRLGISQDTPVQSIAGRNEPADTVEAVTELCLIKEETSEEDFRNHSPLDRMKIMAEKRVELGSDVTEKRASVDKQTSPGKSTEELGDDHRSRHGVWEVSGLETVLKAEPEKESVNLRPHVTGTEGRAERVNSLASEYAACERADHLKTCFVQRDGEVEAGDSTDLYVRETNLKILSAKSRQPPASVTEGAVSKGWTSFRSAGWESGGTVDSVQVKEEVCLRLCNKDTFAQQRQNIHDGGRAEMWHESLNVYPPNPQVISKESLACIVPSRGLPASSDMSKGDRRCKDGARERRFLCTFCGKGFSCPKKVEIHQRVHTGEKPFSCTQCRKRFAQSGNLKRHQRVHTGEKPFSCLQCEKRFSHLHQLKMHQRVHTGERPFICMQCGKRFGEKSYLKVHQQKNHMMLYNVK